MVQQDRLADKRLQFLTRFQAIPTNDTLILLNHATEEAARLHHNHVGTEHLLLGAIKTPGSAEPLESLGVTLPKVRSAVEFIIGRGERPVSPNQIGLTPRANLVVELGIKEAETLAAKEIEPSHIVLGIVREGEGIAAGVLESLGVSSDKLRMQVMHMRGQGIEKPAELNSANDPLARLEDVKSLLSDPRVSQNYKNSIGANLAQLYQTYAPKPNP